MSETVTTAPNGLQLDVNSLEQTFTYDGDFVETITVEYPPGSGMQYVQTFTNDGTNITSISAWTLT